MFIVKAVLVAFLGVVCVSCAAMAASSGTTFYIATDGNDGWSGTLDSPNSHKTDGPFATLERARDRIREFKKMAGLSRGSVNVVIRGGVYERSKTFELNADDSGSERSRIVYRAKEGECVRLVGGRVVKRFKPVTDRTVLNRLVPEARGKVLQANLKELGISDFGPVKGGGIELFFNGKPMTVARWPNEDFVEIVDVVGGKPYDIRGTVGDKVGKFTYDDDRPKRWAAEKDAWVHGYWFRDWSDERQKIESIDTEKRIIAVVPPYHKYGYRKGQWYYAFNLLSEIDSPGEWYLDRETGVLYFWPPSPIEDGCALVSVLDTMITMSGTSRVSIRGVTVEAVRRHGIVGKNVTKIEITGCTLRNLGAWAVKIYRAKGCVVRSCDIYQTGQGGIILSGGNRRKLVPAGNLAENNHIHHYS